MCWNKQFPWGLISNKAASCISAVLVEGGSFVGVPRIFHLIQFLLCERLFFFGRDCPWCLLQYFKYTFYFNLPWKESFLGNTPRRLMFDKCL